MSLKTQRQAKLTNLWGGFQQHADGNCELDRVMDSAARLQLRRGNGCPMDGRGTTIAAAAEQFGNGLSRAQWITEALVCFCVCTFVNLP